MKKTKIAIAGIGGVGGFFGGKLAAHFKDSEDVEIYFIARGENEKAIKEKGLRVETTKGSFTAYPDKVTHYPADFGVVDYLICCTKGYDLEQSIEQLKPAISGETIILPLLNGVDAYDRIKKVLPENEVWDGCVYIVSKLAEAGLVKETGNIALLDFGARAGESGEKTQELDRIFREAGVEARLSSTIVDTIWEKYSFIATVATLTSWSDSSIGAILEDPESKKLLFALLEELKAVADAKGINLPDTIVEKNIQIMEGLPYDTTSSMQRDFRAGKPTEVDSLTGYIVKSGKELQVPTPTFDKLYQDLKSGKRR